MRNTLTSVILGAFSAVAAATSCGDDDATPGGGGQAGTTIHGGSSGRGGSDEGGVGATDPQGGSSGSSGSSGRGGTAGTSTTAELGQPCTEDAECGNGTLHCVRSDGVLGGGPPGGLCSAECESDADCEALARGALCFRISDTTAAVCFEGCAVGPASDPDCHAREDFACQGYETVGTSDTCTSDADCGNSAYCDGTGVCQQVLTACLPACGGDFHCGNARCDARSGFCASEPTSGLPHGALCDPDSVDDPCAGFCVRFSDDGGMCSSNCNLSTAASCGFDPDASAPADATCLWSPLYADPTELGTNDPGFCGPLCDCADDCAFSDWTCFDGAAEFVAGFAQTFGRAGFCGPPTTGNVANVLVDCGGGAGSGGQNGGESGATSRERSGEGGASHAR